MPDKAVVTVAIPTLLGGPTLSSCLRALSKQRYRDFEVIVVNNGAGSINPAVEPANFPFRVLSPGSNIGFGAAVNLAFRESAGSLIATLNDDAEPDENWLEALVAAMQSSPRIGMCACRIQLFGTDTLDSAGMLICGDGSSKQRGQAQPSREWPSSGDALLPSGCAAVYARELLNEIGLFDEDFFLYCEDTDLGLRARWAGWECRYVADAVVYHHYSRTAGAFSLMKAKYVERNRLWVAIKNFPLSLLIRVPAISVFRYFWQLSAIRNRRGAASGFVESGHSLGNAASVLWAAHWETLLNLPGLLRKRAACRTHRRIGPAEFSNLLERHRIGPRELAYSG